VTIAISTDRSLPIEVSGGNSDAVRTPALGITGTSRIRHLAGVLEDAVLLVLVMFLLPLGILLVGAPIALCVRVFLEIARRL
jgi:hypothetical protein